MATTFPTTLDNFTNPQASDKTDSPSHAGQHADLNDAVEALQAKVGVDSSAVATSHDYKLANLTVGDITDLTASASELNIMDGVTATYEELNKVDGLSGEIISGASKLYIDTGWGYIVGNGSAVLGENVSFNVTFDAPPLVYLTVGYTLVGGTSPTAIEDFTTNSQKFVGTAYAVTTSQFAMQMDNYAGNVTSAANSYGYTWLAIGTYTA